MSIIATINNHLNSIKDFGYPTINSLSGGKTSSYMTIKHPADYNIFAVVLTKDPNCKITDKGLLTEIKNKCPQFEGSRELDQTLINILRLEQEIGQEIIWVSSELTYEELIARHKVLPDFSKRYCTQELKIKPIFNYIYTHLLTGEYNEYGFFPEPCNMRIGFRIDELKRVLKGLNIIKTDYGYDLSNFGECEHKVNLKCDLVGQFTKKHRKQKLEWRVKDYPLFRNYIFHRDIIKFWDKKGWNFPTISNCDFCFLHKKSELVSQYEKYPERAKWWIEQENLKNATFNSKYSLSKLIFDELLSEYYNDDFIKCAEGCTD